MSSDWSSRRKALRAILDGDACVAPASVYDPLTARVAEDLGYEMGMYAGSMAALAILGAPDWILITLTEFAEQARRVNRAAATLPVLADADHGYGNALSVMRTVEECEAAGLSGITIEDTALPVAHGQGAGARLLSLDEGVGKMRAALAARGDRNFQIFGRTSAAEITSVDDAIARARAYQDTGVDALFILGLQSVEDIDRIADAVDLPLMMAGVMDKVLPAEALAERGVRVCLRGHQPYPATAQAVHSVMKALRDGTPPGQLSGLASADLMNAVRRQDRYDDWAADFLDRKDDA